MQFANIQDMIHRALSTGKISSKKASILKSLCACGMAAIAASELKKVQPYRVNEDKQVYELI